MFKLKDNSNTAFKSEFLVAVLKITTLFGKEGDRGPETRNGLQIYLSNGIILQAHYGSAEARDLDYALLLD